jgi:hypothetical protein
VTVGIDEPRGDDAPVDLEDQLDVGRIHGREIPDGEDPVAEDANVGTPGRTAGPVHDGPPAQEQVERGHQRDGDRSVASGAAH